MSFAPNGRSRFPARSSRPAAAQERNPRLIRLEGMRPPTWPVAAVPNGGTSGEHQESDMISEMQIHSIARQMIEKHGFEAIAQAAQNALACEGKGDSEEAREWRHIEDAMKIMRGPHQG